MIEERKKKEKYHSNSNSNSDYIDIDANTEKEKTTTSTTSSYKYLDVDKTEILSKQELNRQVEIVQNKDTDNPHSSQKIEEATEKIIRGVYRTLVLQASRSFLYAKQHEVLMQAGIVGILKAIRSFDTKFDTSFDTYATIWIRKYIYMEIHNINCPVKINKSTVKRHREEKGLEYTTVSDTAIIHMPHIIDTMEDIQQREEQAILDKVVSGLSEKDRDILSVYFSENNSTHDKEKVSKKYFNNNHNRVYLSRYKIALIEKIKKQVKELL